MALQFRDDLINSALLALLAGADGGTVAFYQGTRPVDLHTAPGGGDFIVELPLASPAFVAGTTNQVVADFTGPVIADSPGTPTWFRVWGPGGNTSGAAIFDGTIGVDATLTPGTIAAGNTIEPDGFTISGPWT